MSRTVVAVGISRDSSMFLAIALNMPLSTREPGSGASLMRSSGDSDFFSAFFADLAAAAEALESLGALAPGAAGDFSAAGAAPFFCAGVVAGASAALDCAADFGAPLASKYSRHSLSTEFGSFEYC